MTLISYLADYFKVLDEEGGSHLLKHDREADTWYLQMP